MYIIDAMVEYDKKKMDLINSIFEMIKNSKMLCGVC